MSILLFEDFCTLKQYIVGTTNIIIYKCDLFDAFNLTDKTF